MTARKIKEHKLMVAALKRGDDIITSGGIVGKVEKIVGNDKIEVLIADNVTVEVIQSTVQGVLNKPDTKLEMLWNITDSIQYTH